VFVGWFIGLGAGLNMVMSMALSLIQPTFDLRYCYFATPLLFGCFVILFVISDMSVVDHTP